MELRARVVLWKLLLLQSSVVLCSGPAARPAARGPLGPERPVGPGAPPRGHVLGGRAACVRAAGSRPPPAVAFSLPGRKLLAAHPGGGGDRRGAVHLQPAPSLLPPLREPGHPPRGHRQPPGRRRALGRREGGAGGGARRARAPDLREPRARVDRPAPGGGAAGGALGPAAAGGPARPRRPPARPLRVRRAPRLRAGGLARPRVGGGGRLRARGLLPAHRPAGAGGRGHLLLPPAPPLLWPPRAPHLPPDGHRARLPAAPAWLTGQRLQPQQRPSPRPHAGARPQRHQRDRAGGPRALLPAAGLRAGHAAALPAAAHHGGAGHAAAPSWGLPLLGPEVGEGQGEGRELGGVSFGHWRPGFLQEPGHPAGLQKQHPEGEGRAGALPPARQAHRLGQRVPEGVLQVRRCGSCPPAPPPTLLPLQRLVPLSRTWTELLQRRPQSPPLELPLPPEQQWEPGSLPALWLRPAPQQPPAALTAGPAPSGQPSSPTVTPGLSRPLPSGGARPLQGARRGAGSA